MVSHSPLQPKNGRKRKWFDVHHQREFLAEIAPKLGVNQVPHLLFLSQIFQHYVLNSSLKSPRIGFQSIAMRLRSVEGGLSSKFIARFPKLFKSSFLTCEILWWKHKFNRHLAHLQAFGKTKNIKNN